MRFLHHKAAAVALAVTVSLGLSAGLAACSDDDADPSQNAEADADGDGEVTPEEVLAFAKERLDETSGVELSLSTDDELRADAFLSDATGVVVADPPAFEGTASGSFQGFPASGVGIISVDEQVYAALLGDFTEFDLPDCVPDPAGLLDPESGFATVLTAAAEVTAGEPVRGGDDNDEVRTPYTATVPGDAVQNLLPCAPGAEFATTFEIDEDGALRAADIEGEFFEGGGDITYSIDIDAYDVEQEIVAP